MATSQNWKQKLVLRSADVELGQLPNVLDEVNGVLGGQPFQYLMADFWDAPGIFTEYGAGVAELRQKVGRSLRVEHCLGGSAFGLVCEVRWRKVGASFRLALVAEADLGALPLKGANITWQNEAEERDRCQERTPTEGDGETRWILLWGTKCRGRREWVEARIPRILTYPADTQMDGLFDHVRLHFVEYHDERGRVVIHRRTGLTAHVTA